MRRRHRPQARPHHPELPEPGRLHADGGQAQPAARARRAARLHDLRGRPLPAHPLQRRGPADDARAGPRRQRRLRLVVLQDRLPRHPRRLPRRPGRPDREDRQAGDEHVHLTEHGRSGHRLRVLRVGRDRRRDRDRQGRARRARRDARRRAAAAPARGRLHAARGRLLHVGAAARGQRCQRAVQRRHRARRAVRQGHRLPAGGRREHASPRLLRCDERPHRRGRQATCAGISLACDGRRAGASAPAGSARGRGWPPPRRPTRRACRPAR